MQLQIAHNPYSDTPEQLSNALMRALDDIHPHKRVSDQPDEGAFDTLRQLFGKK